jgi:predicted DNA-binding transcriptional regulator AlpA
MQNASKPKGIAREAQRYELTGVPTSTWYDLQNAGLAPKPIRLGGPRSVGWLIEELEAWRDQRRAERDAAGGAWQPLGDAATRVVSKLGAKP